MPASGEEMRYGTDYIPRGAMQPINMTMHRRQMPVMNEFCISSYMKKGEGDQILHAYQYSFLSFSLGVRERNEKPRLPAFRESSPMSPRVVCSYAILILRYAGLLYTGGGGLSTDSG